MTAAVMELDYRPEIPLVLRTGTANDENFIYSSWLKNYQDASPWGKVIPNDIFFKGEKKIITKLLEHACVVVASPEESPSQILGYVVFSAPERGKNVLHFVYVKHPFRKFGIGSQLVGIARGGRMMDEEYIESTHWTRAMSEGCALKWRVIFNPYLMIVGG